MTYQQIVENARPNLGAYCKGCPECDGRACRNHIPGPGAKGVGDTAILNYDAWKKIRINMDTLVEGGPVDTSFELFGKAFAYPFFAGPVGAVSLHYGPYYDDLAYNAVLVRACAEAGIAAFTGDGSNPAVMGGATAAIKDAGGIGIPTVKPWSSAAVAEKMQMVRESGAFAAAMDVDAAGLAILKNLTPAAGPKSVEELRAIIEDAGVPFIVKGIMTARGARKAQQAGAAAIVVSNHGGRVLDQCPATADVLPGIAEAVKGSGMRVLVDGGIRSGADVFKALALGADAVIIARPFITAVYGGGAEGVAAYVEKIGGELKDTMEMCGVHSLREITKECLYLG